MISDTGRKTISLFTILQILFIPFIGFYILKNEFELQDSLPGAIGKKSLVEFTWFWLSGLVFFWIAESAVFATVTYHVLAPDLTLEVDLTQSGWTNALSLFKFPLGCLAAGLASMGLVSTIFRSGQTQYQIEVAEKSANINAYHSTMKSFSEYVEGISREYGWKDIASHKLFNVLFSQSSDYSIKINESNCRMLYENNLRDLNRLIKAIRNRDEYELYICLGKYSIGDYIGGSAIGNTQSSDSLILESFVGSTVTRVELPKGNYLKYKFQVTNMISRILQYSILSTIDTSSISEKLSDELVEKDHKFLSGTLQIEQQAAFDWLEKSIHSNNQVESRELVSKSGQTLLITNTHPNKIALSRKLADSSRKN
ncbi:hypothetical protein [Alteromonas macleodii]|uniref:hypothetical protein n=1 Tax=Alteromonas macleodii TaxID=28108 RepID=UPI000C77CCE2|nr:hypothetical protein [Alteromonas macleodii]AUI81859.1 hypothetical protein TE101_05915 [Alteromonas macleodii]